MSNRLLRGLVPGYFLAGSSAATDPDEEYPSVTVYPVIVSPTRLPVDRATRIGIVGATLLQKVGPEQLELTDSVFEPPETNDVDDIA